MFEKLKGIFKNKNKNNLDENLTNEINRSSQEQTPKKKFVETNLLIGAISSVVLLFILICLLTKSVVFGSFGLSVANFFLGAFGLASYGFIPVLLAYSVILTVKRRVQISRKNYFFSILGMVIVFVLALHAANSREFFNLTFANYIKTMYNAKEISGVYSIGGVVSGTIIFLLQKGLTVFGMYAFLVLAFLFCGLILTGVLSKEFRVLNFKKKNSKNFKTDSNQRVTNSPNTDGNLANTLFVGNVRDDSKDGNTSFEGMGEVYKNPIYDNSSSMEKTINDLSRDEARDILYGNKSYLIKDGSVYANPKEEKKPEPKLKPVHQKPIITFKHDDTELPKKVVHGEDNYTQKTKKTVPQRPIIDIGSQLTKAKEKETVAEEKSQPVKKEETYQDKINKQLNEEKILQRIKENRENPIIDLSKKEDKPLTDIPPISFDTLQEKTIDEVYNQEPVKEEPVKEEPKNYTSIFEQEVKKDRELFDSKKPDPIIFENKVTKTGDIQLGITSEYEEIEKFQPEPRKEVKKDKIPLNTKYDKPSEDLLVDVDNKLVVTDDEVEHNSSIIVKTLAEFQVDAIFRNAVRGPAVTRYEFELAPGISVKRIIGLADDIAMRIQSKAGVRIEAPIPGKNLFGIEVPNKERSTVGLKEIIKAIPKYKGKLKFAIGRDISGGNVICDLADAPHVLVAGATGTGKSVCLNSLIVSLVYNYKPDDVKLILIDPKAGAEFAIYSGLPHLVLHDAIIERKQVLKAFDWLIDEMEDRYRRLNELGTDINNIELYNASINPNETRKMPYIVVIIDELNDLMCANKQDKSAFENKIQRLAQKARAIGIHLVLATQRPSVDVITGVIKANLPTRIGLSTLSGTDSRTILDRIGCENLLSKGDMLYLNSNYSSEPIRVQGAYVTRKEIKDIVEYIKANNESYYDQDIVDAITKEEEPEPDLVPSEAMESGDIGSDEFFVKAIKFGLANGYISGSVLQRRFRIGFNRAGRIMDELDQLGYISKKDGSKPRQVILSEDEFKKLYPDEDLNDY